MHTKRESIMQRLVLISLLLLLHVGTCSLSLVHGFAVTTATSQRIFRPKEELNMWGNTNGESSGENNANTPGTIPKITTVESLDDFTDFLKQDDRLCIVKFHAAWCKSCQKFGVKFRHLAMQHGDLILEKDVKKTGMFAKHKKVGEPKIHKKGRVRFAQVEFGANTVLCKALEIKRLPSIHIYKAPMGKLSGFAAGPKKFPTVVETLEHYMGMSDEEIQFELAMEEGSAFADSIVSDLAHSKKMSKNTTDTTTTSSTAA